LYKLIGCSHQKPCRQTRWQRQGLDNLTIQTSWRSFCLSKKPSTKVAKSLQKRGYFFAKKQKPSLYKRKTT